VGVQKTSWNKEKKMNVFKIFIGVIVLMYVIFFVSNVLFPATFPKEEITKEISQQIEEAKKEPGKNKARFGLKFAKGIVLTKKDFETKNTIIEFQCNSGYFCCNENQKCNKKIEWNKSKVEFNEQADPLVNTRCEEIKGTNFCRVYFGKTPAQAEIKELKYNNNFNLSKEKLKIEAEVFNAGNTPENAAVLEIQVFIVYYERKQKIKEEIKNASSEPQKIKEKETKKLETEIEFTSPGEYLIKAKVKGNDFGFQEKEFTINVLGEKSYDCKPDKTRKEIIIDPNTLGENKIVECEIKYYCMNCLYAFECKHEWEKEFPNKNFELKTSEYTIQKTKGTNCK
jgi:hypothetical protein